MLQVTDGTFYGVNPAYGPTGSGSIYKLTSANVLQHFCYRTPLLTGTCPAPR